MKNFTILLFVLIFLLCGCSPVGTVTLPERTPAPTPAPMPSPTPEPTPTPIPAPADLEELSARIGVHIEPPTEPVSGYALTSIGYDGSDSGALKYTDESGAYLLFTITDGVQEPDAIYETHDVLTVNGIEVYAVKTGDLFSRAFWHKNSNTYQLLAEPALDTDTLISAVSEMMTAALNNNADSVEAADLPSLETLVGFSVPAPSYIAEGYTLKHIYALYGQLPVQIYTAKNTELTFVKSEGIVHPPRFSRIEYTSAGDYTRADGALVSLYYTENGISLAEWILDGYGYSITATDLDGNPVDLSKKEFLKLIDGFTQAD